MDAGEMFLGEELWESSGVDVTHIIMYKMAGTIGQISGLGAEAHQMLGMVD